MYCQCLDVVGGPDRQLSSIRMLVHTVELVNALEPDIADCSDSFVHYVDVDVKMTGADMHFSGYRSMPLTQDDFDFV